MGEVVGSYTATLKVDGAVVDTVDVIVGAGATQTGSLEYTAKVTGEGVLELDGQTTTVTVLKPAEFVIGSPVITPAVIVKGDIVTVEVDVQNVGDLEGAYTTSLLVDGELVGTEDVAAEGGATRTVHFTFPADVAGELNLEVGDQAVTVTVLMPALLQVDSLSIAPALVFPKEESTVNAEVTNIGEAEGDLLVSLKVDGVEADNRLVTLAPGGTKSTSFKVIRDIPGTYDITIGDMSTTFTVSEVARYASPQHLYSISHPADWTLDDSDPNVVIISRPGLAHVTANVEIHTLLSPSGTSLILS